MSVGLPPIPLLGVKAIYKCVLECPSPHAASALSIAWTLGLKVGSILQLEPFCTTLNPKPQTLKALNPETLNPNSGDIRAGGVEKAAAAADKDMTLLFGWNPIQGVGFAGPSTQILGLPVSNTIQIIVLDA